jgi:hypothetical protein
MLKWNNTSFGAARISLLQKLFHWNAQSKTSPFLCPTVFPDKDMFDAKFLVAEALMLHLLPLIHSDTTNNEQDLSVCSIVAAGTITNRAVRARHKHVNISFNASSTNDILPSSLNTHATKTTLIARRTTFSIMAFKSLYEKQGLGFRKNFKGKTEKIREQHDHFWSQRSAKADVIAYFNRTPGHIFPPINKWVQADTIFTTPDNKRFDESANAFLIGNYASFDVAQYPDSPGRAGMSMIHLLALPKAALFNGVSLDRDNVQIIDEMVALFRNAWPKPEVRQAVLEHQRMAIERQRDAQLAKWEKGLLNTEADKAIIEDGYQAALKHYKELEARIDSLDFDDFQFGLHIFPDQSISHLHLHIVATPLDLRQYSTSENDMKTKDAYEVRDFIKGLQPSKSTSKRFCGFL